MLGLTRGPTRLLALLLALSICGVGCAGPSLRDVQVKTNAQGLAKIYEGDGKVPIGSGAPPHAMLDAGVDHDLRIEADGYEPARIRLSSHTSAGKIVTVVATCVMCPLVLIALPFTSFVTLEPEEPFVELKQSADSRAAH